MPSNLPQPRSDSDRWLHQSSDSERTHRRVRNSILILLSLLMPLTALGCSRAWYRRKADEKTYGILVEKALDPRWQPNRIDTTANPDSRFYDPYDVNCPPLPPDDPAAHVYMHQVYGKKGWKHWHRLGDTNTVENPAINSKEFRMMALRKRLRSDTSVSCSIERPVMYEM